MGQVSPYSRGRATRTAGQAARALGVCAALGALAGPARAEPLRVHGTAAAARAVGGHQQDELGWGGGLFVAGELSLSRAIGLQLELGSLWLSDGEPPSDPRVSPAGAGSAAHLAAGLRLRPFYPGWDGSALSPAGLWLSAAGGVARTGELTRPLFDVFVGWDVLLAEGRTGVGPAVGYLHVFQPNDEFRPADANVVLLGVHGFFGGATRPAEDGDRDGDGIKDSVDRCPDEPEDFDGFEDADGCPDLDNDRDGIPDAADECPNDPEDKDGFQDEDGCPDPDNDGDGIPDSVDKCPGEPEDFDGFEDEDGCPDLDNDQDGIPDAVDQCPNEPETFNKYHDEDGCPDAEQVRVVGDKILLDDRVHFWTNSAKLRPVSYPLLERVKQLIADNPSWVHIEVHGHTDERGPEWFNKKLSQERAESVASFLVSRGLSRERLSAKGFGSAEPLVDKKNERAWFLNRRVEFQITRERKVPASQAGLEQSSEGEKK
ncbi:MAG: OmpA family protein [Polyangiaceae bacterium]|nr:OmpA family protein [Polyangiaceae bacterium]